MIVKVQLCFFMDTFFFKFHCIEILHFLNFIARCIETYLLSVIHSVLQDSLIRQGNWPSSHWFNFYPRKYRTWKNSWNLSFTVALLLVGSTPSSSSCPQKNPYQLLAVNDWLSGSLPLGVEPWTFATEMLTSLWLTERLRFVDCNGASTRVCLDLLFSGKTKELRSVEIAHSVSGVVAKQPSKLPKLTTA